MINLMFLKKINRTDWFKWCFFFVLLVGVIFTRFWNINETARFTRDESSDLLRMHQYWQEKKITLVGPISSTGNKVFSSLTYYMQLPVVILNNFTLVSPAIATAAWGVLTVFLLFLIWQSYYKNKKLDWQSILFLVLCVVWHPLVITSRWAWNPHLIPFWLALGFFIERSNWKTKYLWLGLALGMTFHHHYLAIFGVGVFGLLKMIELIRQKKWKSVFLLVGGALIAILPFIIFDLRHPPGLFFGAYLSGGVSDLQGPTLTTFWMRFLASCDIALREIVPWKILWIPILFLLGRLMFFDWKNRNKRNLIYIFPVIAQIFASLFVEKAELRYFLPATIFVLMYLLIPREIRAKRIATIIMAIMTIASLFQLPTALTKVEVSPSIAVVSEASAVVTNIFRENEVINNPNIAALTGDDLDALGEKYRDVLAMNKITFKAASEYDATENLFVISNQDEETVRNDPNYAMRFFQQAHLVEKISLKNQPWSVYWFNFEN